MARIVYSTSVSLDGYIADPEGQIDWSAPDDEPTLAQGELVDEITRLREQPGKDIGVGGANLASTLVQHDFVDDYDLFVCPVVLGGGTPYFPTRDGRLALELVGTRTFPTRVVHLRYRRA